MITICKQHNKKKTSNIAIAMLMFVLLFAYNTYAAVHPKDVNTANAVCSTTGISNKQYDTNECQTDNRCAAASGCIDATPLAGVDRISSPFGERTDPLNPSNGTQYHKGVDYRATTGTPIYAAADGCIIEQRYQYNAGSGKGWGNTINLKVNDPSGTTVRYAHLSCFAEKLAPGVCVKKGQLIGFVGNTGGSTGPHLHYEVMKNGKVIDPLAESSSDVMCTVDETIKKMDENAKAGGNGSTGEAYGTGTPQTPGQVGFIDSPSRDGYSDKDCFPRRYKEKYETCIFCNLFRAAFVTASNIAKASFDTLAPWVQKLMAIAFAVWIAFQVIKFVSAMESKDAPTLLRSIINQTFVFIIAYFLLNHNAGYFMQLALEPIFNTGFKLAQLVMSGDIAACDDEFDISSSLKEGGLPASMGISILCTLKVIQDKLLDVITAGSAAMCIAMFIKNAWIFPHPAYLFSGLGLWVVGMLLLIIFPFLMLDAVLQLAVSCALLPAAIAAWAFKETRGYVTKVWESFLKAMFSFVFLTIIMMILITILDNTIGEAQQSLDAVNETGGAFDVILNDLSWTGVLFLNIVFVCLLGWAVLGQIAQFSGKFASSVSSTNIGAQLGTLGASGAKNMTQRIIAPGLKAVHNKVGLGAAGNRAKQIIGDIGETISAHRQTVRANKFSSGAYKNKTGYNEVTDNEGNTTYSYIDTYGVLGKKKQHSVTINKDGKIIADNSSQVTSIRGRTKSHETYADGNIEIKNTVTQGGNEVKRDVKIKDKDIQNMIRDDGKINMDAVNKLRATPGLSKDAADEIIITGIMQQRMPDEMKKLNLYNNIEAQGKITRNNDGSISLTKLEKNGSSHEFRIQVNPNNGNIITRYIKKTNADKNGMSKSTEMFSNGVFESVTTNKIDANGNIINSSKKFGINKNYHSDKPAINRKGELRKGMPAENIVFAGMSKEDIEKLKQQYKEDHRDIQNSEFDDTISRPLFGDWGRNLRKRGFAVLNQDKEFEGLSPEEIEEIKKRRAEGTD